MMRRKAKLNIPLTIGLVVLCLTLLSVHFTGGMYAKYLNSVSEDDSARVIFFGDVTLTESGDFYEANKLMIIPGVDLTKKAVVNFKGSEASTYIFIEVIAKGWIAIDKFSFVVTSGGKMLMQWSVMNDWNYLKKEDDTYVFYRELMPNTVIENADIIADNGKISVSEFITKSEIATMNDISIKLRATAVQSGGFASPEAAWDSVAAKEE